MMVEIVTMLRTPEPLSYQELLSLMVAIYWMSMFIFFPNPKTRRFQSKNYPFFSSRLFLKMTEV